jgi:putative DNA primase/helicase
MAWEAVPSPLRELKQWLVWKREQRDGHWTKVPYSAKGGLGSTTNPDTWSTFEEVGFVANQYDGIGFVFTKECGIVGIDLDHIRGDDDTFTPEVQEILEKFNSYAELSPSGKGIHILCQGTLPGSGRRSKNYEVYSDGRYFTVTGNVIGDYEELRECQEAIDWFFEKYIPKEVATSSVPVITLTKEDLALLEAKFQDPKFGAKWKALFEGRIEDAGYNDHSRADMAFMHYLAEWTGNDTARMDRIFRNSRLWRKKYERDDYRNNTISKVISKKKEKEDDKPLRTELEDAEIFSQLNRDELRYLEGKRDWIEWNGSTWEYGKDLAAMKRAIAYGKKLIEDSKQIANPREQIEAVKHGKRVCSAKYLQAIVKLSTSVNGIVLPESTLDSLPMYLNTKTGIVNLERENTE